MPDDSSADYVLLTRLADEFAARYRAGERPSLQEYIDRHPTLADEIRELFPAMAEIEQVRADNLEAAPADDTPPPPTLKQLGDFRIIREVGKGGMGIVYEAEQMALGRHVALKVLPRAMLMDPKAKRRFEREAKSAAKLHHTNIVPVFGVGEQDGLPYYVMQFIQGLGLDQVLDELKKLQMANAKTGTFAGGELRISSESKPTRTERPELSAGNVARSLLTGTFHPTAGRAEDNGKPSTDPPKTPAAPDSFSLSGSSVVLPGGSRDGSLSRRRKPTYWRSVASIGAQVGEALEYAHKQGIHHRDIKPSNLLLDRQGTVWVTDFGLAKADDQQNLTHTGDILGTLRYMPPEAFDGKTDARSDVYSLGLTLYEMLAFRPAFNETERHRLIKQVTTTEPVRLGKLNRQLPRDLETIVHKAIEKDPRQRYASAGEMAEDLRRFVEDEPIKARRVSPSERLRHWCRRNPWIAGLTAVVAGLLIAVALGSAVAAFQIARSRDEARQNARSADDERQLAERNAEESRRRLVRLNVEKGMHFVEENDPINALPWLAEALRLDSGDPAREEMQRLRIGAVLQRTPRLAQLWMHDKPAYAAVFSPDGKLVATGSADKTAKIWDADSGALLQTLRHDGEVTGVTFAPDGRSLLTMSGESYSHYTVSQFSVWDLADGRRRFPPVELGDAVYWINPFEFTPDGKAVTATYQYRGAAFYRCAGVKFWDSATGHETSPPWHDLPGVVGARFNPAGGQVVVWQGGNSAQLLDSSTGKPLATLDHRAEVIQAEFSGDGTKLVTLGFDRQAEANSELHVWDTKTGKAAAAPVRQLPGKVIVRRLSRDGKRLVSISTDLQGRIGMRLWDTGGLRPMGELKLGRDQITDVEFSHEGRLLLGRDIGNRGVTVFDATTGEPMLTVAHTSLITAASFSPDGTRMVSSSTTGAVRLWQMEPSVPLTTGFKENSTVSALAFDPAGKQLAVANNYGTVVLRDPVTGERVGRALPHAAAVRSVAFSPNGRWIVSASADHTARLWDAQTREPHGGPLPHPDEVVYAGFSPDSRWVVTTTGGGDLTAIGPGSKRGCVGQACLWDVETGKLLHTLPHKDTVCFAGFSPDARRIVTASCDKTACVWDAQTGALLRTFTHPSWVHHAAFSPDGTRLVTSCWDASLDPLNAYVWDLDSGELAIPPLPHNDGVTHAEFSPDGRRIVTAGEDAVVRLWDAQTGKPATPPMQHSWVVRTASFSPDGRTIFTAGLDGVARLWDAETGEALMPAARHARGTAYGMRAACSFAARRLATGGSTGEVRLWDLPSDQHTVEDLALLAGLLGGRRLDSAGGLVPFANGPLREAWRELATKYPADFTCTPAETAQWCRYHAREAEMRGERPLARTYYDRIIAMNQGQPRDWLTRATLFYGEKRWPEALRDFQKAEELGATNPNLWLSMADTHRQLGQNREALAVLTKAIELTPWGYEAYLKRGELSLSLDDWEHAVADFAAASRAPNAVPFLGSQAAQTALHLSDLASYRKLCAEMIERHGRTTDVIHANLIAWTCALGPDALPDLAPALRLAELAVRKNPDHNNLNTLGAILYRANQTEAAVKRLQESIARSGGEGEWADWVFLAMAHQRLGHADEARRWLAKVQAAEKALAKADPPSNSWEKIARAIQQDLRREAETLIGVAAPP